MQCHFFILFAFCSKGSSNSSNDAFTAVLPFYILHASGIPPGRIPEPQPHYLFPSEFTVFHLGSVSTVFLQFCRGKGEILRKTYKKGAFQVWNYRFLFFHACCLAGGQFSFLCGVVHHQKCVKARK